MHPSPSLCATLPQVQATCIIEGQYALTNVQNWPAQIQLCGPTGGDECSVSAYDPAVGFLIPSEWCCHLLPSTQGCRNYKNSPTTTPSSMHIKNCCDQLTSLFAGCRAVW